LGGSVTGQSNVGGLVGLNNNSSISNSYTTGLVTGNNYVGGLVGENDNSSISHASAAGDVAGQNYVGGLVGENDNSSINHASAAGEVTGQNYVGGLTGYNDNNSTVSNVYATGAVIGSNYVGGLVGQNNNSISNAYWNMQTTGQLNGVGGGPNAGIGLTSAQMLFANSFAGFDIDDQGGTGKVWRIYEGQTAPLLRSFLTQATLNAQNQSLTYNGQTQGLNTSIFTGLDYNKLFSSQSSSKNVGTYNLSYYSNQQGYDLINNIASLTINKAAATVTANSLNTTYNGLNQTVSGFSASGLVNGETAAVLSNVSASVTEKNAGSYVNQASGTDSNYELTFIDGS
ncbi:MAG: GLUG motif-containing protein, partial [Acinetobacter sp.]